MKPIPTPTALLDTNILLRHITRDHPDHTPRSAALIERIAEGTVAVRITDTIVFETVFTLVKQYGKSREDIASEVMALIDLRGMILPTNRVIRETFDRWVAERSLSFADAYHLSFSKSLGLTEIVSFDQRIAKEPSITRLEPLLDGTLTQG